MKEIFKSIPNFSKYEVSNLGRIRSKNNFHKSRMDEDGNYIFKGKIDKDGYVVVGLQNDDGKRKHLRVHRLVAQAFLDNPNNELIVNHKNGIKDDNRLENLEWCSISYNAKHSFDVLNREPSRNGMKEVKKIDLKTGEVLTIYPSLVEAAKEMGVSPKSIGGSIRRRKNGLTNASCKGYKWEFVEEG